VKSLRKLESESASGFIPRPGRLSPDAVVGFPEAPEFPDGLLHAES
jgi:hypothetical protein